MIITDCLHSSINEDSPASPVSSDDYIEDPLEDDEADGVKRAIPRKRLFDDTFGDLGLAASIFRILGTPTEETWPVSLLTLQPAAISYESNEQMD